MTTYARIVNGIVLDVVITPPALAERFAPDWLAAQTFVVVPDGTEHGAISNGDGTYTNPPVVPPPTPPQPLPDAITVLQQQVAALAAAISPAAAQAVQAVTPAQQDVPR